MPSQNSSKDLLDLKAAADNYKAAVMAFNQQVESVAQKKASKQNHD